MSVLNGDRTLGEGRRILLVEDEPDLARLIRLNLESLQHEVTQVSTLNQARQQLRSKCFDLLLLDRMLSDGDGLTLCQQLRQEGKSLPCMMITARDSEADIVLGLESGADDYLVKPFSVLELRARVKALLRRSAQQAADQYALTFDELVIDSKTREVTAANQPLALTAREFDLLYYLAQHPRQVFSRMQLLEAVWGYSYAGYEHTVNSHINRLRAKLACCPSSNELVQTVWGVGYKFAPPAAH
ncbi:response regulator transcription factor [Shewanella alkalitolerans]|uniref:response regulator transcription factor n=1 Tax=Shewanella alkalitolerans TaxID=2864209 RepID=UPI001C65FBEA|nr:response regulator transcription factor [Shewanella alkalitolerans]QYJ97279.1 response regulator transcription factor [Shewanella alkalitolerans]